MSEGPRLKKVPATAFALALSLGACGGGKQEPARTPEPPPDQPMTAADAGVAPMPPDAAPAAQADPADAAPEEVKLPPQPHHGCGPPPKPPKH
jgi:hypothetical protein